MKTFTPKIILHKYAVELQYNSQYELMYSMARFQEFYENPYLKCKSFTRQDLQDISPDYYISWNGCNFPKEIINCVPKLDRHELLIHDICSKLDKYIIGTHRDRPDVLKHELAHARFHCDGLYYANLMAHFGTHKSYGDVTLKLVEMGYHISVIPDEIQAYAVRGWDKLKIGKVPATLNRLVNA